MTLPTETVQVARLAAARARTAGMAALLREYVEIESPSDDPAAVAAFAERVGRDLSDLGLAVERVPVHGSGPVLAARSAGDRPTMLLGHLDTVWPMGTLAARPVTVEGDVLRGPGCYDMKAGLVVAVEALRLLAAEGPLPPVTVFFTPLEEVDCEPYRALMEDAMRACRAVLDFEPAWPGGAVKTERKGSGSFLLRAHGRAAHAGADLSKGANAILEIARQSLAVTGLNDPARGVSVNVGVVRGGTRSNVVPERAEAEVDFRVKRVEDARTLEAAVHALRSTDPGVRLEIEGGLHYPPLERTEQVLTVYRAARAVAAAMGQDLAEISTGGASEASFAGALGLPTLDGLGADGDGAHAIDEHVLLSSLPDRAALAAGLIAALSA
ncbi:MAG: M20 family metallopeptidase [Vicinamibacteria bacterium]